MTPEKSLYQQKITAIHSTSFLDSKFCLRSNFMNLDLFSTTTYKKVFFPKDKQKISTQLSSVPL